MLGTHTTAENLEVLYEDNHVIAVNKRCGDIAQGDKTKDVPLSEPIKTYLKVKNDKPGDVFLGVIHRLDRPVSGVTLFAKTSKALTRMNDLFVDRNITKMYWAVVQKNISEASQELTHWLKRNPDQNKTYVYPKEVAGSKIAVLSYRKVSESDRYALLEVILKTGRHHQIRSQLAHIGSPIKGDLKYGYNRSNSNGGIHLHARELSFVHPIKNIQICIKAPVPKDPVWNVLEAQASGKSV